MNPTPQQVAISVGFSRLNWFGWLCSRLLGTWPWTTTPAKI